MNRLDLFLIAVLLLAAWTGWRRGALQRVLSWGGFLAGVLAGAMLAPLVVPDGAALVGQAGRALGALAACGIVGGLAGHLVGRLLHGASKHTPIGTLDAAAGAALSVAVVALIAWFLALNLSNGPSASLAAEIQGSLMVQAVDSLMPDPPDLLARVRDLFGKADFPQVFSGLPPVPTGAVEGPSRAEAQAAFDAAAPSSVRVVGEACGRLQEGSGFVVAPNSILTNAHVVAGADTVEVQTSDGTNATGTVVLFDPALDAAMIRVADTPGEPLPLADEEFARGTGGAVVGHPEGGDLTGVNAAVTRVIDARGRDIYGRRKVTRRVYELQAAVVPGSSGSPFVLPDGRVAAMVFAASTTDREVGYAVTSGQLELDVSLGSTRTQATDTGDCI